MPTVLLFIPDKLNVNSVIKRVDCQHFYLGCIQSLEKQKELETFCYFKCIYMLYGAGFWLPEILPETHLGIFRRIINSCGLEGGLVN